MPVTTWKHLYQSSLGKGDGEGLTNAKQSYQWFMEYLMIEKKVISDMESALSSIPEDPKVLFSWAYMG